LGIIEAKAAESESSRLKGDVFGDEVGYHVKSKRKSGIWVWGT